MGADIWLFDPGSVANEILLPLERIEELRGLLEPHHLGLQIIGDESFQLISTNPNPEEADQKTEAMGSMKMYQTLSLPDFLAKFVHDGEVGRGRNKTALSTAKQVVKAVCTAISELG